MQHPQGLTREHPAVTLKSRIPIDFESMWERILYRNFRGAQGFPGLFRQFVSILGDSFRDENYVDSTH